MPEKSDSLKFSPRERFMALYPSPERANFRSIVLKPVVQHALTLSFAELASMHGITREQLDGALNFISLFQNFSEPAPKAPEYPDKGLKSPSLS